MKNKKILSIDVMISIIVLLTMMIFCKNNKDKDLVDKKDYCKNYKIVITKTENVQTIKEQILTKLGFSFE